LKVPAYLKYKQSGVSWLGDVPQSWDVLSVKRLTPVQRGASPRPIEDPRYFDDEGYYAWVRIADVTRNHHYLMETTQKLSDLGKSLSVPLEPGSLFLSIAGSVGKPMITKIKACIHDGFVYFPQLEIEPEFLYYIFESGQPYLGLGKLGTQLNLNTDTVGDIKIGVPSLTEQKQIADFLDWKTGQIDGLIAKKKQLIEKLKEKRLALITQAVTKGLNPDAPIRDSGIPWLGEVPEHWEILPIKFSLSIPITDGPHETPEILDEGIPFLSAEAVKNDCLDFNKKRGYISQEDHDRFSMKYHPRRGDIYMVKSGATTGNVARVETEEVFNIWSPLAALRPMKEKAITDFIFYFMKSKSFFYSVELAWSYGTQQNIGMGVIENLKMALPPIDEQREISKHIKIETLFIDKMIDACSKTIDRLTEYRTALITAATTGKIDVRKVIF